MSDKYYCVPKHDAVPCRDIDHYRNFGGTSNPRKLLPTEVYSAELEVITAETMEITVFWYTGTDSVHSLKC